MTETWRNGLCGHCCGGDCGTCMGAWFCSPCLFGRESSRLDHFPDMNNDSTCNGSCLGFCGLSCLHAAWILVWVRRSELRNKFGIRGDGCADCAASYFCTPCALAQMNTEIKDRAATPSVMAYDAGKMGYPATQPNMNYGPAPGQY